MNLTGQQINNTYGGLLKTEDNAALPGTGLINITDGLGNQSGIQLDLAPFFNTFNFSKANPAYGAKNLSFDRTAFPFSAFSGNSTALLFTDLNGLETASILQDRFGGLNYKTTVGSHIFMGQDAAGTTQPGLIRMDAFNSINNSDNWLIGYNQSVTDLQIVGQDLTLSRQGAADLTVTIPGGGGGAAGLESGTGADSMQSAASLTTTGANASGEDSIALGDNARAEASKTIALGLNARAASASTTGAIAIGPDAAATNNRAIAIGVGGVTCAAEGIAIGDNLEIGIGSDRAIVIGNSITLSGSGNDDSIVIGTQTAASAESTVVIGRDANATAFKGIAIGRDSEATGDQAIGIGSNAAANGQDSIAIGRDSLCSTGEAIAIGTQVTVNNFTSTGIGGNITINGGDSFTVGTNTTNNGSFVTTIGSNNQIASGCEESAIFGSYINLPANTRNYYSFGGDSPQGTNDVSNSIVIGTGSFINDTSNAIAIGSNIEATRSQVLATNELELQTTGGGIYLKSPNGTEYKITVTDGGALAVALA